MRKKIAFIGHSYHKKTKSSSFFLDYLRYFYEVKIAWDKSWKGGSFADLSFVDESYLGVVFWQTILPVEILDKIDNDNLIFIPMYDGVPKNWEFWKNYKNLKIINFSKNLHEKLVQWGFDSMYIQYFPEVGEFSPGKKDEVFFWQRITRININTLKNLFREENLKIHIHKAIDPGYQFVKPSQEDEERFQITYSDWFGRKEEMVSLIEQKGIYVAPRESEGIGMSFLEAMAMGKAVVAVNNPTMNEYIKNGETGYLFDSNNPQKINLANLERVQRSAYEFMREGRKKWEKEKSKIIDFIKKDHFSKPAEVKMPLVNIVTVAYNAKEDLERTIRSVAEQDYPRVNYIIVDGGSTDGTKEMVENYKEAIDVFISEKDKGVYDAMNKGIGKAKEGYISFLNAGDVYIRKNAISNLFRNVGDSFDLVYGKIVVGDVTEEKLKNPQKTYDFTKENLLRHNTAVLCHQAMFLKKEKAPLYNTAYKLKGDLDWYFEILKKNPNLSYYRSDVVVVSYRGGGMSEKRYFLDVFELAKLIVERFGLGAFFRYGYHSYSLRRICHQNKFSRSVAWLFEEFVNGLVNIRRIILPRIKKIVKIANPLYRKVDNDILSKLDSLERSVSILDSSIADVHSSYKEIESMLDNTSLEVETIEKRLKNMENIFSNLVSKNNTSRKD